MYNSAVTCTQAFIMYPLSIKNCAEKKKKRTVLNRINSINKIVMVHFTCQLDWTPQCLDEIAFLDGSVRVFLDKISI